MSVRRHAGVGYPSDNLAPPFAYIALAEGQATVGRPRTPSTPDWTGTMELIFEVTQEADGGYVAECLTEAIFTQADTWEELRLQARDAVTAFFFDRPAPGAVRLRLVRDEVLVAA